MDIDVSTGAVMFKSAKTSEEGAGPKTKVVPSNPKAGPMNPKPHPDIPKPAAETDADIAAILAAFIQTSDQRTNLANLLLIPPIRDFPEIKAAGPNLAIETVIDPRNTQFAAVRKRLIAIERQTKMIPQ